MTDKTCAVPHCGKTLYAGNTTGVCRGHNHTRPFCRCIQCDPDTVKPVYRPVTREEVTQINEQTVQKAHGRVTLPPVPWEASS